MSCLVRWTTTMLNVTFPISDETSTHSAKMAAAASHHLVWPEQYSITVVESDSASTLGKPREFAKARPFLIARASEVTTSDTCVKYLHWAAKKLPFSSWMTAAVAPVPSSTWNEASTFNFTNLGLGFSHLFSWVSRLLWFAWWKLFAIARIAMGHLKDCGGDPLWHLGLALMEPDGHSSIVSIQARLDQIDPPPWPLRQFQESPGYPQARHDSFLFLGGKIEFRVTSRIWKQL